MTKALPLEKLALAWLGLILLVAALATMLPLPYFPGQTDLSHVSEAPFNPGRHWLGTDPQGRDVLSSIVFGARTAVTLTLPAALLSAVIGALLGSAAGFWGNEVRIPVAYWLIAGGGAWWALDLPVPLAGLVVAAAGAGLCLVACGNRPTTLTRRVPLNGMVMAAVTTLDTIPRLLLVVVLATRANVTIGGLLLLLTCTAWPSTARLVRAQMLRVCALPFIEAARAGGASSGRIWFRHALPHAVGPLRIALPLSIAGLLGLESTLSFLGIGLPPDVATWGHLLAAVRVEPEAWWVAVFPGACLLFTMLSLITLGRR